MFVVKTIVLIVAKVFGVFLGIAATVFGFGALGVIIYGKIVSKVTGKG